MGLAEDREALRELGFDDARAEKALKAANGGLDAALDWLEKHDTELSAEKTAEVGDSKAEAKPAEAGGFKVDAKTAKSVLSTGLKCVDCDKLFKNQALASYHSDKSGHVNFEEVEYEDKPLTEAEKQERLDQLRAKVAAKRLAEQAETKKLEAIRRKGGKESQQIKEDLKRKELEKEIAQRKKDKELEAKARAKVKQAIEDDKKERARKAALEKSKRLGLPAEPPGNSNERSVKKPDDRSAVQASASKEYTEGKFQLRLPDAGGTVIVLTIKAEQTLFDLANALFEHPNFVDKASVRKENLMFSTPYPRKVFNKEEMAKNVKELRLVPSVALAVSYG